MCEPSDNSNAKRVSIAEISNLLEYFAKNTYKAKESDAIAPKILKRCIQLMEEDYKVKIINNSNGELCSQYPSQLIILENEIAHNTSGHSSNLKSTIYESSYESQKLREFRDNIMQSKFARCRERFPIPVILYKGKYICRSSTLSGGPEIYGRTGLEFLFPKSETSEKVNVEKETEEKISVEKETEEETAPTQVETAPMQVETAPMQIDTPMQIEISPTKKETSTTKKASPMQIDTSPTKKGTSPTKKEPSPTKNGTTPMQIETSPTQKEAIPTQKEISRLITEYQLHNHYRQRDINLLKFLNVDTIVDLMVEMKKVKYGLYVTSSEKVDKENRYAAFKLVSLPYPGCEFFKEFCEASFDAKGLVFEWSQEYVDAEISIPPEPNVASLQIDWENYKEWDLRKITKNYIKLILKYFQDSTSSILIHCISGWDRTPLFVSLIRLSLWADGLAHQSLDVNEILYLTIAYDWMLFGHHLSDRISKKELIFVFCFYMVKYLADDEFSIAPNRQKPAGKQDRTNDKDVSRTNSDLYLDGILLDADSRGSNLSLNSFSSTVSTKSQDQPQVLVHTASNEDSFPQDVNMGFPNSKEFAAALQSLRTSPLQDQAQALSHHALHDDLYTIDNNAGVPSPIKSTRSPQSSKSSPMQVPMRTTRLRSRPEPSPCHSDGSWQMVGSFRSLDSTETNGTHNDSNDGTSAVLDDEEKESIRKQRLCKIRKVFYRVYFSTVGVNGNGGTTSSIGTFLGDIAEKVGLSSRT